MAEPTYIFRDGKVYTFVDGKVVAAVKESDFGDGFIDSQGQEPVQMPKPPHGLEGLSDSLPCPECGKESSPEDQFCSGCGAPIAHGGDPEGGIPGADLYGNEVPEDSHMIANTVVSPNGLKGRVLGRTKGLWGDTVTVRFENGVIRQLPVSQELTFEHVAATEAESAVEKLSAQLSRTYQEDRDSLIKRAQELKDIKNKAQANVGGSSDAEAEKLHDIVVQASFELREVEAALAHIESKEVEAFEPFAPITNLPEVEQESLGGRSATWLDRTVEEMAHEAASTDYAKLMDEGPEAFIAGLDDDALADAGAVRHIAQRHIASLTAGADDTLREKYDRVWLARVEEQRRQRLAARKEEVRKEAAAQEDFDAPDDALFL